MAGASRETIRRRALREARRVKGWTQARLADEVGCRQSAVSMYEHGDAKALSEETVVLIAEKLGVDLEALSESSDRSLDAMGLTFCVNPDCHSNVPFVQGEGIYFIPSFVTARVAKPTWCTWCGEVRESVCRNEACRAPVEAGVCCSACGTPYVQPLPLGGEHDEAWADAQKRRILELRALLPDRDRMRQKGGLIS